MYERYAALRDKRKMNDAEVAKTAGIPASTLYDWKAGRYQPKLDKLVKIADALGESIEYFLK